MHGDSGVITTIAVNRQDSGQSVRINVGDVLEVSLSEREPTAGWKAEFDESILGLVAETAGESVWLLGEGDQNTVRQFRAKKEGNTTLRMLYQRLGDAGVATLDTFTLEVTVGAAPPPPKERVRVPLPEMVFILIQVFIFAVAFFVVSFLFGVYAGRPHELPEPTSLLVGLIGAVFAGAVAAWSLIRLLSILIYHRTSGGR